MKKTLTLLLAALMILSLAACRSNNESTSSNPDATESVTEASTDPSSDTPTESLTETSTETGAETVGQILLKDFQDRMSDTDAAFSAEELAQAIISNPVIAFQGAVMPVEEGLLTGFDNAEITGFKEGVMFAPSIGTIPFVGYIFVLEDESDADSFVQTLKDNANLRWNICTAAEELIVERVENTVFFLMSPRQLGE